MTDINVTLPTIHNYTYKNITISGLPGNGSTTLLNSLRETLKFDGWKGFSGGEFMRAYAEEKGLFQKQAGLHHSAVHYEDDFDLQVDMGMRHKLQTEEKWILEAWLSAFMAQNVPDILKVLVICSDDAVRIDRIVNRDNISVEVAKQNIHQRYTENFQKWSRMYQPQWQEWIVATGKAKQSDPIDFWRPDLYDLVIDTYSTNKSAALELVLHAIQKN